MVWPGGRELIDQLPEIAARDGIDAAGRFVQKQNGRLVQDRAAQRQPLLPASREQARQGVLLVFELRHFQHKIQARGKLFGGDAVDTGEEFDVLFHRHVVVERKFLRHVADAPLDLFRVQADVEASHHGAPGRGSHQAAQHANGGGFPGAIGPQKTEDLTRLHVQIQVRHRGEIAEALGQLLDVDRRTRSVRQHAPAPACAPAR